MPDKFINVPELYAKTDWEGGLVEAIFGYGLRAECLPEGTPPDIVSAWKSLDAVRAEIELIERWLEEAMEEYAYE